jgi:ribose transport system ATP-binding protein
MSGTQNSNKEVLLEAKNICKTFGPTVALSHVELTIYRGEIRGLIGENGSGKSTMSSIVAGMQPATKGEMFFRRQPYKPATMIEGAKSGVGMIVQEMGTISGITVAQNIFLGNEHLFRKYGLISAKAMNNEAKKALVDIGCENIDPSAYIDSLDIQDRKLVEIAKVMYSKPEILIVDETTTALSQTGRIIIYNLMNQMKKEGKAVLFISHDLDEMMEHCDSLTVLRDGVLITTLDKQSFDASSIKRHMVGREIGDHYYRLDRECSYEDEVVIRVENLTTGRGLLENVSLELHKGEILGIGGLSHCGMHELGRAIFGEEPIVTGRVIYAPTGEEISNARAAMKYEMGYVSKNRDMEALVLTASVRENIVGAGYDKVAKHGVITQKSERRYVDKQVEALQIKCSSIDQQVKSLSGGNKQKVVFGKWIGRNSKILILDCPTRGVDIGVKAAMYHLMEEIKAAGNSILMISEELNELIGMCDRLLILKDGKINGELRRDEKFDENTIINYMI